MCAVRGILALQPIQVSHSPRRPASDRRVSRQTRLAVVLVLNLLLIAGLVVVGLRAHSLGVLAAGADYLADAAAIGVSLFAMVVTSTAESSATRRLSQRHQLGSAGQRRLAVDF